VPATPVALAVTAWGTPSAARRALLVHGLSASGATWWRIADGLAHAGYHVTAPDLRGHGRSPRTMTYRLDDHVADFTELGGGWDLVIGHSLGGLVATALATTDGFTRRLLLLDPVLDIPDADVEDVVADQLAEVTGPPGANPRWHPEDVALKAAAVAATSPYVVERCLRDNLPWHFTDLARRLTVPTVILGADPALGAMFTPAHAADNPRITVRIVAGAAHNIHREDPAAVLASALE
jgi:pimeloyl-ACP methyl ester carboxylesterase